MASMSTAGNHKEGTTDKDSGNVMANGRTASYKNRREVMDGEKMSEDEQEDDGTIKTSVELVDECEEYLKELEKEKEGAASAYKPLLEEKIKAAQCRLKAALVNLSIAEKMRDEGTSKDDLHKHEEEVIEIDDEEEEDKYEGDLEHEVKILEEKRNKKEEVNVIKNTKYKRSEIRWADINSDDEDTVVLQNHGKQQDEDKCHLAELLQLPTIVIRLQQY